MKYSVALRTAFIVSLCAAALANWSCDYWVWVKVTNNASVAYQVSINDGKDVAIVAAGTSAEMGPGANTPLKRIVVTSVAPNAEERSEVKIGNPKHDLTVVILGPPLSVRTEDTGRHEK